MRINIGDVFTLKDPIKKFVKDHNYKKNGLKIVADKGEKIIIVYETDEMIFFETERKERWSINIKKFIKKIK